MKVDFDTARYISDIKKQPNYFHTFLNRHNIAAGVLVLQPGEEDTQTPHDSDEVYYVVCGNGSIRINKKDYDVSEGKAFYVQKNMEHFFHSNTKELVVMYFFGGSDS